MSAPAAGAAAAKAAAQGKAPPVVIRTLYRNVLREATKLDGLPVTKTLLPMPKKLQEAAGLTAQLHMPSTISYTDVARQLFREDHPKLNLKTGFDALQTLRKHHEAVTNELPRITNDHDALINVLDSADVDKSKYWARKITVPTAMGALLKIPGPDGKTPETDAQLSAIAKQALMRRAGFEVKVGTALMAHPLSSAHADRRVLLIVEKTSSTATGVVLDMLYSYPLSHGNPMFPEVLWGHEVHNGGYCHVDFTMPPTANVSVLHTLDAPVPSAPTHSRWLQWATGQADAANPEKIRAEHEACCIPVIKDGDKTLYYSRVEALPYLSALAQGQPRDCLRVYWGCVKWSTPQLVSEIAAGHWMPVNLSPDFFRAYTVPAGVPQTAAQQQQQEGSSSSAAAPEGMPGAPAPIKPKPEEGKVSAPIERFPTREALAKMKAQREEGFGANITPPQQFPPTQPMCRREALWDQVMHSLGGEYRHLVGTINPFINPRAGQFPRVPPIAGAVAPPSAAEPLSDGMPGDFDVVEIDADDEEALAEAIERSGTPLDTILRNTLSNLRRREGMSLDDEDEDDDHHHHGESSESGGDLASARSAARRLSQRGPAADAASAKDAPSGDAPKDEASPSTTASGDDKTTSSDGSNDDDDGSSSSPSSAGGSKQ